MNRWWATPVGLAGGLLGLWLAALSPQTDAGDGPSPPETAPAPPRDVTRSAAYVWLDVALEATAREHDRNGPRPTVGSRMLAIVVTAMYDAWAAYDDKAVGTRLGGKLRRPPAERTAANKEKADRLRHLPRPAVPLPRGREVARRRRWPGWGYDPADTSTDPATPAGRRQRRRGGGHRVPPRRRANQHGDEVGSDGKPYSDYTFYRPVNPAGQDHRPGLLAADPVRRRQGRQGRRSGSSRRTGIGSSRSLSSGATSSARRPPPKVGSEQLRKEVDEVLRYNANLTARAEGDRRVHARRAAVDRAVGPLAAVRPGRVAARPARPRPGREAVLRRRQRGDGRVHRRLGGEAVLRQLAAVDARPALLRRARRSSAGAGRARGVVQLPGRGVAPVLAVHVRHPAVPRATSPATAP